MTWTLQQKFLAVFVFLAILNGIGAWVVISTVKAQKTDALEINLAGAQRMLSQKMAKETLLLGQEGGDRHKLQVSLQRFDTVLRGLRAGSAELGLPGSSDPEILAVISTVEDSWAQLKPELAREQLAVSAALVGRFDRLMKLSDDVVKTFERKSREKVASMEFTAILVLGVVLGVLVGAWWAVIRPLVRRLRDLCTGVASGASQVASASGHLSGSSKSLAQAASDQLALIDGACGIAREMREMSELGSGRTLSMANCLQDLERQVARGNVALSEMSASIDAIAEASGQIGKITNVVDEVAFQTNVLALNAAVEAARAGEAGRGFSVVADEVRNLSRRSAQAAQDASVIVAGTASRSDEGKKRLDEVTLCFQATSQVMARVKELIAGLTDGTRAHQSKAAEILGVMSKASGITQSAAASSEENAAASQELHAQASTFRGVADGLMSVVGRGGAAVH